MGYEANLVVPGFTGRTAGGGDISTINRSMADYGFSGSTGIDAVNAAIGRDSVSPTGAGPGPDASPEERARWNAQAAWTQQVLNNRSLMDKWNSTGKFPKAEAEALYGPSDGSSVSASFSAADAEHYRSLQTGEDVSGSNYDNPFDLRGNQSTGTDAPVNAGSTGWGTVGAYGLGAWGLGNYGFGNNSGINGFGGDIPVVDNTGNSSALPTGGSNVSDSIFDNPIVGGGFGGGNGNGYYGLGGGSPGSSGGAGGYYGLGGGDPNGDFGVGGIYGPTPTGGNVDGSGGGGGGGGPIDWGGVWDTATGANGGPNWLQIGMGLVGTGVQAYGANKAAGQAADALNRQGELQAQVALQTSRDQLDLARETRDMQLGVVAPQIFGGTRAMAAMADMNGLSRTPLNPSEAMVGADSGMAYAGGSPTFNEMGPQFNSGGAGGVNTGGAGGAYVGPGRVGAEGAAAPPLNTDGGGFGAGGFGASTEVRGGTVSGSPGSPLNDTLGFDPMGEYTNAPAFDWKTSPAYQFRVDEGMRALENSASARGGLLSGGFARDAINYAGDSASQEFDAIYNRLGVLAGYGTTGATTAANSLGQYGTSGAAAIGYGGTGLIGAANSIGAAGYVNAAGTSATYNAISTGIGDIAGAGNPTPQNSNQTVVA